VAFTSAPILAQWNLKSPLIVEMDVSNYTLAAILSMQIGIEIHPIVYYSRTFNSAELNYNIYDKELMVIYETFRRWRHYLKGTQTPVDVVTDHKNLVYFTESKPLS